MKLRRGGTGTNFCVHKYFFERSDAWRQIHEEELRAQAEVMEADSITADVNIGITAFNTTEFGEIDARHLSNINILRHRLVKYLKQSEDGTRPYYNIAVKLVSNILRNFMGRNSMFVSGLPSSLKD